MIKSDRSKRRKIRKEINLLTEIYSTSNDLHENNSNIFEGHNITNLRNKTIFENSNNSIKNAIDFSSISSVPVNLETVTSPVEPSVISSVSDDDQEASTVFKKIPYINDFLSKWGVKFNISHNALNGLLNGLKKHNCFNNLPSDSRTLLKIPSNISTDIRIVEPGIYHHFGLSTGILKYTPSNINNIQVVIGIDGLPLSKSNNNQFWPILAYIKVKAPLTQFIFLVGLYYGKEKPMDSNDYLSDLVLEAKNLTLNVILINSKLISVSIHVFCCDEPAKSFILKVKGHSGFYSCTRCTIEGEYLNNRVCFPYTKIKSTRRNHQDYVNILDEDYHISSESSNLIELPNFNSVSSFSLDYMHLVCLGVMKKLLLLWLNKGPINVRLRSAKVNELTEYILNLNSCVTSDFVRRGRTLQELCRWKV